ncbi:MAG: FGGY family carbohydrate kinase, partial [Candidatus Fimenecus sp.]
MDRQTICTAIQNGETALGVEFGSTRIKAVLIDADCKVLAQGSYDWENQLIDGIWSYPLPLVLEGLRGAYSEVKQAVRENYGVTLKSIGSIGISAMMHGYLPFDKSGEQLVPFRTWRNTITETASAELTEHLSFNIPQRWSAAHLYHAILENESHLQNIAFLTTLAGYVHWQLTGEKVLGVGEASGMFPVDSSTCDYDCAKLAVFDTLAAKHGFTKPLYTLLPKVLSAGEAAGTLTETGARLLDPTGDLASGIPFCPPEGDAGTGMVATNSVAPLTGNVSAGTSIFAMAVLEKPLSAVYPEIDMVTTPTGAPVAMVHCNTCTSDLDAWVNLFAAVLKGAGAEISKPAL